MSSAKYMVYVRIDGGQPPTFQWYMFERGKGEMVRASECVLRGQTIEESVESMLKHISKMVPAKDVSYFVDTIAVPHAFLDVDKSWYAFKEWAESADSHDAMELTDGSLEIICSKMKGE